MKNVAKYNLFKGVSSAMTFGTPIVTLACCGEFFKHNSDSSISAAGMFVILIMLFFAKDKLAENFKMPAPFILCGIALILIIIIEQILYPIKMVCITTMIASGIDEFTFKRYYNTILKNMPENAIDYRHLGFIFTTSKNLNKE